MKRLERHHHFRADLVPSDDRVARLETMVVQELLDTSIPDAERDSGIAWELKHSSAVTQFGRLLGAKRGLDAEACAAGALLHDIYAIRTGSYSNHARLGGPIAESLLQEVGGFSPQATDWVLEIVVNHSDKHLISENPYVEFGKDVDILDCFLYPGALDEYILTKPADRVFHYLRRAKAVWEELDVPIPASFRSLDTYTPDGWLSDARVLSPHEARTLLLAIDHGHASDPFVLSQSSGEFRMHAAPGAEVAVDAVPLQADVEVTLPGEGEAFLVWPGLRSLELLNPEAAAARSIDYSQIF